MKLRFYPVTRERWKDLETLFGKNGACGGCWCRYWKETHSTFVKQKGEGNKKALKKSVHADIPPGILAYDNEEPVAWCSVEPRENFGALARSRVLKPLDDQPVWSVPCFFVKRAYRKRGVTSELLKAAAKLAKAHGARILEGYPVAPKSGKMPDVFAYTGFVSSFEKAGFTEAARRSETRPVMRRKLR